MSSKKAINSKIQEVRRQMDENVRRREAIMVSTYLEWDRQKELCQELFKEYKELEKQMYNLIESK